MSRNRRNKRDKKIIFGDYSKQLKISSIILSIIVVLICIIILILKTHNTYKQKEAYNNEIFNANIQLNEEEKQAIEKESKRDVTLTITAVGNILCEDNILSSVKDKNYDFSNIFNNIKKYINNSDISIGSIETNFINENYSGNILYNSPIKLAEEIKNLGIDLLFLGNNHSMDYGINGIKTTLQNLNKVGIETVGLKQTEEATNILIKECRNIKLAFLSYTYGTNLEESEYEKYVNIINKEKIQNDILKSKEQGAEYIIISMHWGNVYGEKLTEEQKQLSEYLVESGADIILGSHPASIQKMETRINSQGKDVLVAYSLGSFLTSEIYQNSNLGIVLNIELVKIAEEDKVYLNKVTYIPTYIQDNGINEEDRYKILNIKDEIVNYESEIKNINEKVYKKLKQGLVKIKELIKE